MPLSCVEEVKPGYVQVRERMLSIQPQALARGGHRGPYVNSA